MQFKTNQVESFNCPSIFVFIKLTYPKVFWEVHIDAIEIVCLMLASCLFPGALWLLLLVLSKLVLQSVRNHGVFAMMVGEFRSSKLVKLSGPYLLLEVLMALVVALLDLGIGWKDEKGARMNFLF